MRTSRLAALAMLAVLVAPLVTSAQGRYDSRDDRRHDAGRYARLDCHPRNCAESGWLADDTATDHTTRWVHGLGTTPTSISILFSPDPDGRRVMPVLYPWQWQTTGNPISIEMGPHQVLLHIWSGAPLHGVWRPGEQWTFYREGYWKIVVRR